MSQEHRRNKRRAVEHVAHVTNTMTGAVIGRIGNLSIDGLLIVANTPMRENALYQLSFAFPPNGVGTRTMEVGVHEQWTEAASVPGQYWTGFRIIDLAPADRTALKSWIEGE